VVCVESSPDLVVRNIKDEVPGEVILTGGLMTRVVEGQPPTSPAPAPEDLMMRLLMDTRVMLPTLQSGPGALGGLLGRRAAVAPTEVTDEGRMPPIPVAPDQPPQPIREFLLKHPGGSLPPPPPPPPK